MHMFGNGRTAQQHTVAHGFAVGQGDMNGPGFAVKLNGGFNDKARFAFAVGTYDTAAVYDFG